jgi:hypothetical protein
MAWAQQMDDLGPKHHLTIMMGTCKIDSFVNYICLTTLLPSYLRSFYHKAEPSQSVDGVG